MIETETHNWLSHDDSCYQKCDFHGGRCEKVCGKDGFCCKGDIDAKEENQDCPLIGILSIPKYKDDFVCVQKCMKLYYIIFQYIIYVT